MDNLLCGNYNDKKNKIKVTEAEIVVHGTVENPYFEIKYKEVGKKEYYIGYGSYKLSFVFEWLEEEFEVVKEYGGRSIMEKTKCLNDAKSRALVRLMEYMYKRIVETDYKEEAIYLNNLCEKAQEFIREEVIKENGNE